MLLTTRQVRVFSSLLLTFTACGGERPAGPPGQKSSVTPSSRPTTPARLGPAALAPVIRALGPKDALPERLELQLAGAVVDDAPRPVKRGTRLTVEPHVPGKLRFTSGATLTWQPRPGHHLRPRTRYRVTLHAVETRTGRRRPAPGEAWTLGFTTPAFRLLRLAGAALADHTGRAELDVIFSGPVEPASLRRRAAWSVDGRPIPRATYRRGDDPYTVRVFLRHPALVRGRRVVRLALRAGVPLKGSGPTVVAPAGGAALVLLRRPPVHIRRAELEEGAQGFYIDVDCDDRAVRAARQYYWDEARGRSGKISARCVLRDEAVALGKIHFNPPLRFTVTSTRHGFRVLGELTRGSYLMRIEAGAATRDGGAVTRAFTKRFVVPSRRSTLAFVHEGRYLPRGRRVRLALRHLNVDRVDLEVRHVPARNLAFWLSGDDERAGERTANLVHRSTLPLARGRIDSQGLTWLDLQRLLGAAPAPGLYELKVRAGPREAALRLLSTAINLVVKRAEAPRDERGRPRWSPEVRVWALSMDDNRPLVGVKLELIRRSGQVLARCATDAHGGCRLRVARRDQDPSPPYALLARRGEDLTYLKFGELATPGARPHAYHPSYLERGGYRASLYGDRGAYRPGETVHLAAILRDARLRAPARLPAELEIRDPRGRVLRRRLLRTNEAGMIGMDHILPPFALTGAYEARLLVARQIVASLDFRVEAYVPERMRVRLRARKQQWRADEKVELEVGARYLFGGSAAGSEVELTCRLVPGDFRPPGLVGYHFGSAPVTRRRYRPVDLGATRATLGVRGTAAMRCPRPAVLGALVGPARMQARAAVFEAGSGRTTVASTSVPVHPERFYLGLRAGGRGRRVAKGRAVLVRGVVAGWDGKLDRAPREVTVELSRVIEEYGWYHDPRGGYQGYQRYSRLVREGTRRVQVRGGRFSLEIRPRGESHGYLVTASAGRTRTDLELEGSRAPYGDITRGWRDPDLERTPPPAGPAGLELVAPAQPIQVGRPATIRFRVPRAGRVLLGLETHKVLATRWRDVRPGEHRWTFTVTRFVPNVYVSALLVPDPRSPAKETAGGRAFGVISVPVRPRRLEQRVAIRAPDEVRPHGRLRVQVDLGRARGRAPRFVTVAAVDEGILALTGFSTPRPLEELLSPRALGVETFDTVGWRLRLPTPRRRELGGGADPGGAGPGRPRVVRSVALWSGLLRVPASGRVTASFEVPVFRGALRVMAVAAGARSAGSAETRVLVRDPLVLQSTPPRYLVRGDTAQVPVFVTNLSGRARTIEVTASSASTGDRGSPLSFPRGTRRTLRLEDRASGTAVFVVRAGRRPGAARLQLHARSGPLVSYDAQLLPVVPGGPLARRSTSVTLRPGRTALRPHLAGWEPGSERSTLRISSVPFGDAFHHLDHLLSYPYGCVEQTTSATRPLLGIPELARQAAPELLAERGGVERMVTHGIRRLLSMQTRSGGLAYWPGGGEADPWGTAYATHLLLDARKQGHELPPGRLEAALSYLGNQVGGTGQRGASHAEAYMHYVLARAGRGRRGRIQELIDALPRRPRGEAAEQAYLLDAALYLAGDRRYARRLRRRVARLGASPLRGAGRRRTAGSYYSERRRRALTLGVFVDLFGAHGAGARLVRQLAEALRRERSSRGYTTQELAWSIDALGKWMARTGHRVAGARLLADGRPLAPTHRGAASWSVPRASERRLALELPPGARGYLFISSRGIRSGTRPRLGGRGLRIRREHLDARGRPIDLATHKLGDLVLTRISLTNTTGRRVDNVALVDRLPAGWEVENPRLGRGSLPQWARRSVGEPWRVEHLNIRDDRLELFGALRPGQTVWVIHVARATAAGRFTAPPVFAEAMYDPGLWARAAGRVISVAGPWARYLH
jgi:uncharacterized protein YfaS (alpha-2-macroglobulin family)